MAENSKISWTDHTFNPWIGCTKVSPGCANCYAATQDNLRKWTPEGWGKGKPRKRTSEANWKLPLKWDRNWTKENWPYRRGDEGPITHNPRVFCSSLADWLDDEVPVEWLADLLALIAATPNLDWLLLTKRPENFYRRFTAIAQSDGIVRADYHFASWFSDWLIGTPPANVWIGTTIEDQKRADERIPSLLAIPAKVRFLSCEPLLEPINISHALPFSLGNDLEEIGIHLAIVGGESGPGFRPFDPDWARSLRDQCFAGVAFHMKQMGGLRPSTMPPIPADLMIQEFPKP